MTTTERAYMVYGETHQLLKAIEELSELQRELSRHLAGYGDREALISEMADVTICFDYLRQAAKIGRDKEEEAIAAKLARLDARMTIDKPGPM